MIIQELPRSSVIEPAPAKWKPRVGDEVWFIEVLSRRKRIRAAEFVGSTLDHDIVLVRILNGKRGPAIQVLRSLIRPAPKR